MLLGNFCYLEIELIQIKTKDLIRVAQDLVNFKYRFNNYNILTNNCQLFVKDLLKNFDKYSILEKVKSESEIFTSFNPFNYYNYINWKKKLNKKI